MIACGCGASWSALGACHCSGCHETFSSVGLFDRHRSQYGERGACKDPAGIPGIEHRNGMWRNPEMTEEQKLARFGGTPA